ncbi:MAG: Hsp70 family protein [Magnetococcales bacterium]|nr:Hsp70 family protein [Magnetococcales bacterium]
MNEPIIGIDLGTTNSEVALFVDGQPRLLGEGSPGSPILPSVVGLDDNGVLLVGETARNQLAVHPERTIKSIKRRMGENTTIPLGDKDYTPQEISALILKRLRDMAQQALGCPVHKAVITVPAYFSDAQRQATREAGWIAGLDVVRMINEPTAAALAYEAGRNSRKQVLVYDLGGGTFDVSVVRIEGDVVEVISSHGNNHLGGDDFDQELLDHILDELESEHQVTLPPNSPALGRLLRGAEAAKKVLSDHPFVRIEEEFLTERQGVPFHLGMEIDRTTYEKMILPYVEETLEAVHVALRDAGLTARDIQEVLLVGGSTRTPLVRERLEEIFGQVPRGEVNPDLCVAMGAAIQGAIIGGHPGTAVLVDITPYTFGTRALEYVDDRPNPDMYVPVIPRNTPIPVSRSELFFTVNDGQESVDVRVYQGEHPDVRHNILIGQFHIDGLDRKAPAHNPILMRFDLDLDGVLKVSAMEKATGLEKRITIDNTLAPMGGARLAQAQERITALYGNGDEAPADQEQGDAGDHPDLARARAIIAKTQGLLNDVLEEDREDMITLVAAISEAMTKGDIAALKQPLHDLSELLFYLET